MRNEGGEVSQVRKVSRFWANAARPSKKYFWDHLEKKMLLNLEKWLTSLTSLTPTPYFRMLAGLAPDPPANPANPRNKDSYLF